MNVRGAEVDPEPGFTRDELDEATHPGNEEENITPSRWRWRRVQEVMRPAQAESREEKGNICFREEHR